MVPNGLNGADWCRLVLNGTKYYQKVLNGAEWYWMLPNCTEWCGLVQIGTEGYQMWPNGSETCKMVPNSAEWCLMVPNSAELYQIVLDGSEWYQMVHQLTFTIYSGYIHETLRLHSRHIQIRLMWLLDCIYILFYHYLNNTEWYRTLPNGAHWCQNIQVTFTIH